MRRLTDALARSTDPRPLALMRIGVGIAAAAIGLESWRILIKIADPEKLQVPAIGSLPDLSHGLIWVLLAVWTGVAAALILGLRARLAAACMALLAASAMLLDQQAYSHHLALLLVLSALLALGRPGAAWSLDARRRGSAAAIPAWPVFLIKLQVSTLYTFAGLSKLNDRFLSGEVLENQTHGFLSAAGQPLLATASVATILVELFLAVGLWSARLQRIAFPLGLTFHLLIVLTLDNPLPLIPFAVLTLFTYPLFLDAKPASRLLSWDETNASCDAWAARLRRLDLLGVHRFVGGRDPWMADGGSDRTIRVLGDGRRAVGYDAVRMALEVCPATFLAAPLLGAPPIARLGRKRFRRAAASAARDIAPASRIARSLRFPARPRGSGGDAAAQLEGVPRWIASRSETSTASSSPIQWSSTRGWRIGTSGFTL